jgi:hypothetical protein
VTRRALVALLCAVPVLATAQGTSRCSLDGARQISTQLPSGNRNTFFGGGIVVRCPARDLVIRADSVENYGDENRFFLIGRVRYDEPRLSLTSDYLTYRQLTEHMFATGNVNARNPKTGSTLKGPTLEYFRSMSGRPATKIVAVQRPTVTLLQKDSTGTPRDTLVVIGDRITMLGDSIVYAGGKVVMTRPEVEATGDSLFIDSDGELMVLMRGPTITGKKDRPFTLTGVRIEMTTKNRKLNRVFAMGQGKAVSQDMTLTSDSIDLRVADDLLQRAIAYGPGRARINSVTQEIAADSIDVLMPGQRIRELHAIRGASAEGQPDTLKFRADTVDWLRGDTIIAMFDSLARRDSASAARLRELVARGNAKSHYHTAPPDTSIHKAAINYVFGRQIVVAFAQQKMSKVTVTGRVSGMYLEPKPEPKPATKVPSDTKAAPAAATPVRPPAARPN